MITNCYYSTYNRTVVTVFEVSGYSSRMDGHYEAVFDC
jgi:hypothetical protein